MTTTTTTIRLAPAADGTDVELTAELLLDVFGPAQADPAMAAFLDGICLPALLLTVTQAGAPALVTNKPALLVADVLERIASELRDNVRDGLLAV